MSLDQLEQTALGKVPKTENILQKAIGFATRRAGFEPAAPIVERVVSGAVPAVPETLSGLQEELAAGSGFINTRAFGIPGLIAKQTGIDLPRAQTPSGQFAQSVGEIGGLLGGAPARLVTGAAKKLTPSFISKSLQARGFKGIAAKGTQRAIGGGVGGAILPPEDPGEFFDISRRGEQVAVGAGVGVLAGPILERIFGSTIGFKRGRLETQKKTFRFRNVREVQQRLPGEITRRSKEFSSTFDDLASKSQEFIPQSEALGLIDDELLSAGLIDDAGKILSRGRGKYERALVEAYETILEKGAQIRIKELIPIKNMVFNSLPTGIRVSGTRTIQGGEEIKIFDIVKRFSSLIKDRVKGAAQLFDDYGDYIAARDEGIKLFKPFPIKKARFRTKRGEEAIGKFAFLDEGTKGLIREIEVITGTTFTSEAQVRSILSLLAKFGLGAGGAALTARAALGPFRGERGEGTGGQ